MEPGAVCSESCKHGTAEGKTRKGLPIPAINKYIIWQINLPINFTGTAAGKRFHLV